MMMKYSVALLAALSMGSTVSGAELVGPGTITCTAEATCEIKFSDGNILSGTDISGGVSCAGMDVTSAGTTMTCTIPAGNTLPIGASGTATCGDGCTCSDCGSGSAGTTTNSEAGATTMTAGFLALAGIIAEAAL